MLILRPHHILCLAGRAASIDTRAFRQNFESICEHLSGPQGDHVKVQITLDNDDLCCACPFALGTGCEYGEEIKDLERRHAELLDVKEGDILTFGELRGRLIRHMHDDARLKGILNGKSPAMGDSAQRALAYLREHAEPPVRG